MKTIILETYGRHANASLELLDEGDKVRLRVREPHGKASIYLTDDELMRLQADIEKMREHREQRRNERPWRPADERPTP